YFVINLKEEISGKDRYFLMQGQPMNNLPKISVILPIRNEAKYIVSTIGFILDQEYPADKLEVLVVDGASDDDSVSLVSELAKRDSRINLFCNPRKLSSAARNIGVRNATGDIIIFIDGHVYLDNKQLLKNTVALMQEKEVSVLSRPQFLETPDNSFFQKAVALARRSIIGHGSDSTIYTDEDIFVNPTSSGASYKREVFDKAGFFDENFDACEDVEFNYRVAKEGYKSFTSMKLAVFYYPRSTIGGLFRQMMRYGRGRFRLAKKYPETISPAALLPSLLTVGSLFLGIAAIISQSALYSFLALISLYVSVVLVFSILISFKKDLRYLPILPIIYLAIHFGLGWGFVYEFFKTAVKGKVS
ncbi:MAG: glycosyltransferase family 2 protein, partial [candidate division Zixibacteria bacterium]|nr:glycosyltransferase family 2 protein [candidate division Zixibacteria bacterium]